MSLTPGVALTNSMREFMAGDMVSGVSRLTEALLIATAIALSTGIVLALAGPRFERGRGGMNLISQYLLPCVYAFFACLGFCFLFNTRGWACSSAAWGAHWAGWSIWPARRWCTATSSRPSWPAVVIAAFSEWMARLRRCPVTAYLLIALFPLVPGRGIYLTMLYCIQGETLLFLSSLLHTLGFAGCLAVGAMLVTAVVRMYRSFAAARR